MSKGINWMKDGGTNGRDRRRIYFSFNTNNGAAINTSLLFGGGDLNPTITNANTGEYIVTFGRKGFFNRIFGADVTIEDTTTGAQLRASIGGFTNEGATNSAPISFKIFTYNSSNALANIANTRIFVEVIVADRNTARAGDP